MPTVPIEPRGEVSLVLGERSFLLKPEWRAYAAISQKLGGVFEGWKRVERGDMEAIAILIWAGATSGGSKKSPSIDEIGELLVEHGFDHLIAQLMVFVGRPIRGLSNSADGRDPDDDGEKTEGADDPESKSD